jgi:hypothetical protein
MDVYSFWFQSQELFLPEFRIRIRFIFRSLTRNRVCIRVESWIRFRILNKIQDLKRHKMEPWRAVYAHNKGMEAQNGALEGL